ncbi:hypothetical protein [Bhargavaea cecembensis]|uniref:hypothetical protein n=1 Tax=Bhargavaea cecembensis TaxID=394098 RepID=UPI0006936AD3|nr:hypothetical protein [Bhargavaea cecembensis]
MAKGLRLIALGMLAVLIAGCSATPEELSESGTEAAGKVFREDVHRTNAEVGSVRLYKPAGFKIQEGSDEQNIVLEKGRETYVLFINPNEPDDSRLFYDLLYADPAKEILTTATYEKNGVFGFSGITDAGSERFELVAGSGGTKMTTLSKEKGIERNLRTMMEIVRSVERPEDPDLTLK